MLTWEDHLDPLDRDRTGWTCRDRVTTVIDGEAVLDAAASTAKDVCDDGHVHTDVTIMLRTPTRLVHVVAGDAQHVTDPHELELQCLVTAVPLGAVGEISVQCWDEHGHPAAELRVARTAGAWQAVGDVHDCGDPSCDIPPGSIQLESRPDGIVLATAGPQAEQLVGFAARLSRAV